MFDGQLNINYMPNIRISIIIATFNAAKTLSRALDSVLNQSFQDWECIIVDGASNDSTMEIVKEYVKKDSRFRYISEPDKGIYDAYNKGWKIALGQWVLYLGSDDELTFKGVEMLIDSSGDADIVYGNTLFRKAGISQLKLQVSSKPKMGGFCCHQSLIMKRELISKLGGFDMQYKILADKDLMCRVMKNHCKIQQINAIISIFSLGGASSPSMKRYRESFSINKKYMPILLALYDLFMNVSKNTCRMMLDKMNLLK